MFDDDLLKSMYVEYGIPCDTLVSDPEALDRFASDYTRRSGDAVELRLFGRYLLKLRKRGEANGGFPRLQRGYNGRN